MIAAKRAATLAALRADGTLVAMLTPNPVSGHVVHDGIADEGQSGRWVAVGPQGASPMAAFDKDGERGTVQITAHHAYAEKQSARLEFVYEVAERVKAVLHEQRIAVSGTDGMIGRVEILTGFVEQAGRAATVALLYQPRAFAA